MKDKKLKVALKSQQEKQQGQAITRYHELYRETISLVNAYRCFIADMHLQHREKRFHGIEKLNEALNNLEDTQKAVRIRFNLLEHDRLNCHDEGAFNEQ